MKFCPECGAKLDGEPKFCPECGNKFQKGEDNVVHRSDIKTEGAISDSIVSRSSVQTDKVAIRDAVISHSTITQTETHQHFGESIGTYETQMDLGRTAFEGKNWEEAVEFFNTALKINSKTHEPWYFKGMSCAELERTDEAVTNLRRALKLGEGERPRMLDELKKLAERVFKKGIILETQAADLMGKSKIELQASVSERPSPDQPRKQGILGSVIKLDMSVVPVLGSSMKSSQTMENIEKKRDAEKRETEAKKLEDQGKTLLSDMVKQYNSAIRFCDLVIEFQEKDEYPWLRKGEIFLRLKLYQDAIKSYEGILAFDPYHREALRLRGMCYSSQGLPIPPPPPVPGQQQPTPQPAPAAPQQTPQSGAYQQQRAPPQQLQQQPQYYQPQMPQGAYYPPRQQPQQHVQYAPQQAQVPQQYPPTQQYPGAYPQQAAPQYQQQQTPQGPQYPPRQAPAQQNPQPISPQTAAPQQVPQPAPAPTTNPCPFCRKEMNFVREKCVWYCPSCKRYSERPTR